MNRWCTVFIWIVSAQWLGALVMSADLYGYNGERDEALSNYLNDLSEKRSWQSLNGPWGKRASDLKGSGEISEYDRVGSFQEPNYVQLSDSGAVDGALDAKRSWKSMNAAWGKRIGDWNKFRGSWGKREPGWNNLKGLWGKRADWNKLSSAWGKRDTSSYQPNNNL